ncbi:hypothetical protein BAE44_0015641 [Dichanthelium oligosanthes]|uniref:Momilactone A synthase n=1 Tax=Dichanthelium oligosanthes TaxID=888268 RepID=A0A1E5VDX7_9POAL|nr:hypothetical protein BAE44_0015641 [Dichanthelium oligosanthes]
MVPAGLGGCIIGTSSLASAVAGAASHAYTCAKRGLVALTENAAAELGRHGIRVNCVSPAAAATPLATGYLALEGQAFEQAMEAVANLWACGWRTSPPPCSTSPATTRGPPRLLIVSLELNRRRRRDDARMARSVSYVSASKLVSMARGNPRVTIIDVRCVLGPPPVLCCAVLPYAAPIWDIGA